MPLVVKCRFNIMKITFLLQPRTLVYPSYLGTTFLIEFNYTFISRKTNLRRKFEQLTFNLQLAVCVCTIRFKLFCIQITEGTMSFRIATSNKTKCIWFGLNRYLRNVNWLFGVFKTLKLINNNKKRWNDHYDTVAR